MRVDVGTGMLRHEQAAEMEARGWPEKYEGVCASQR